MSEVTRYLIQKTPIGTMMKPNAEGNWIDAKDFDRVTDERDALQERLNAADERADVLERDAARYRWLRDVNIGPHMIDRLLFQTVSDDCNPPYRDMKHGIDLDAAIDAELKR